ncbi:MAG: hypothetical protein R3D55_23275 [Chloroflexota bacterium]
MLNLRVIGDCWPNVPGWRSYETAVPPTIDIPACPGSLAGSRIPSLPQPARHPFYGTYAELPFAERGQVVLPTGCSRWASKKGAGDDFAAPICPIW